MSWLCMVFPCLSGFPCAKKMLFGTLSGPGNLRTRPKGCLAMRRKILGVIHKGFVILLTLQNGHGVVWHWES